MAWNGKTNNRMPEEGGKLNGIVLFNCWVFLHSGGNDVQCGVDKTVHVLSYPILLTAESYADNALLNMCFILRRQHHKKKNKELHHSSHIRLIKWTQPVSESYNPARSFAPFQPPTCCIWWSLHLQAPNTSACRTAGRITSSCAPA